MKLRLDRIEEQAIENKPYVNLCYNAMTTAYNNLMDLEHYENGDKDENSVKIYERNFIIEYAISLCKAGFELTGHISAEVAKSLYLNEDNKYARKYADIKRRIDSSYSRVPQYVFPDFLIHESNDSNNLDRGKQHFIIEAKTRKIAKKEYFYLDFLKLNYYVNILMYDNAAYLFINNELSDIQEYLDGSMEEDVFFKEENIDRFYFFIQKKETTELYKLTKI